MTKKEMAKVADKKVKEHESKMHKGQKTSAKPTYGSKAKPKK
jgi:hypothetical protein